MLDGLKVLDLTRVLAGPLCTMLLGDLGADVIKIERPGHGDETRGWGPPFDAEGRSAYYLSINRNKLSVEASIDDAADRELLVRLVSEADIVVDNFRGSVLSRRGLGAERFMAERPDLVWCTITGFGAESDRAGYDFVTQAECGWMAITGEQTGEPMKVGVALADVIAGQDAAIAILGAIVGKLRTGRGRRIVISLVDSARAALVNVAQNALVSGRDAKRWGNAHPNLVPYQLFSTADRPIVIAVGSDAQWVACARALGAHELADDPLLATNAGRLAQRARIVDTMRQQLVTERAATWQLRLDAVGIPNGVVKTVVEALSETSGSALMGMPSAIGGAIRLPPPGLGDHGPLVRQWGWEAFRHLS